MDPVPPPWKVPEDIGNLFALYSMYARPSLLNEQYPRAQDTVLIRVFCVKCDCCLVEGGLCGSGVAFNAKAWGEWARLRMSRGHDCEKHCREQLALTVLGLI